MAKKVDTKKSDEKKEEVKKKTVKKGTVKKEDAKKSKTPTKKTTVTKTVKKDVPSKVEETKKTEEKKKWKLVESKTDIVILVIVGLFFLGFLVSPDAFLITTGLYGQGSDEVNEQVRNIMGEDDKIAEEHFNLYFDWFNVVHEIGHGIIREHGVNLSSVDEEQLVNDFAAAFWKTYGEEEKLNEVLGIAEYALDHLESPIEDTSKYLEYAKDNFNKSSFMNSFNNYGFFQFSCVKAAINKDDSLEEVLSKMGVKEYKKIDKVLLMYDNVTSEASEHIIGDVLGILKDMEISLPNVYHRYSKQPHNHSIRVLKNLYGLFDLFFDKIEVK